MPPTQMHVGQYIGITLTNRRTPCYQLHCILPGCGRPTTSSITTTYIFMCTLTVILLTRCTVATSHPDAR